MNEKHQNTSSSQNGDKMADTCINKLVSSPLWVLSIFVTSHTTSRVTVTASSHTTTIMIIFFIQIGVQKYCIHHSNQRLMSWLDLIDDCL